MSELLINTKPLDENICLVVLNGVLDNETAKTLSETFHDLFARRIWKFVVDLSDLNYMGSPGIGLFISFIDSLEEHKGTIVFIYPQPNVKEVFKIFKLSNFYSITRNLDSAIKELRDLIH
ncbi:MAG: STAS domain-containing protein [Planctomycetota bacterium]